MKQKNELFQYYGHTHTQLQTNRENLQRENIRRKAEPQKNKHQRGKNSLAFK